MFRKIFDIYEEYTIPPWLRMHMYRVAAIAATLFDARAAAGDDLSGRTELITACLLHDMGNVIKFDFSKLPLPDPSEHERWETIRTEFISKYGKDEHTATIKIMDEIGVSEKVHEIFNSTSFLRADAIEKSGTMLQKFFLYADSRVVPSGVASLAQRFADARVRYAELYKGKEEIVERQERALYAIECELFRGLHILPADITENEMADMREKLKSFDLPPVRE